MSLNVSYIPQESRLDLSFHGNLDLTLSQDVCEVLSTMPADLECCIIDLAEIDRLFDSGVALLQALHRRLKQIGAMVVILSDHPEMRKWFPTVVRPPLDARSERPPLFVFGQPPAVGSMSS
jgi:anti-anti-sigma regulatory factor